MEQCDWLMIYQKGMVVWSSATGGYGVQSVMALGTTMMQQWCADSWAIVQSVSSMNEKHKASEVFIGVGQGGTRWPGWYTVACASLLIVKPA